VDDEHGALFGREALEAALELVTIGGRAGVADGLSMAI